MTFFITEPFDYEILVKYFENKHLHNPQCVQSARLVEYLHYFSISNK